VRARSLPKPRETLGAKAARGRVQHFRDPL
jgi:hypothetical protein